MVDFLQAFVARTQTVGDFTFDLTFAEPIRWAKVQSEYVLSQKLSDFAERK